MNLRALLVDDEPLARQRIRHLLRRATDFDVAGECSNGLEAVKAIEDISPDLVFLDIQMPELDGFGVVEAIGADRMPPTLFITAYDQHALHAFEVHALDYLLKPFSPERFHQALERARRWCTPQNADKRPDLEALLAGLRQERPWVDRLLVKQADRHVLVKTAAIQWIEAEDNYVRLLLTSNQPIGAWGDVFGDPVVATAILDRLLHHSHVLTIKGDSHRLKEKRRAGIVPTAEVVT